MGGKYIKNLHIYVTKMTKTADFYLELVRISWN